MSHRHLLLPAFVPFLFGFLPATLFAGDTDAALPVVRVQASASVIRVVKSLGPQLVVLTPADHPVKSLTGLKQSDVGFWLEMNFDNNAKMTAFYRAIGITDKGIYGLGDGAYESARPPLYFTTAEVAQRLKNVARVEFVPRRAAAAPAHAH